MPDVVVYVSSHGFGHAVRAAELVSALRRRAPGLAVVVRTAAPRWMFPPDVRVVERDLDSGAVQPDSLTVDPGRTLARYAARARAEAALIEAEVAELRAARPRLIVADVPAAAFAVADRIGVPGVGVANFCWDWIYEPYVRAAPAHAPLLGHLRGQYGLADCLLRLPLHGDLSCFRRAVDVPLIARRGAADRAATRRALGLPREGPLVLLSFGGFSYAGLAPERLGELDGYAFVATSHEYGSTRTPNLFVLPRVELSYIDLLAACDAVVTKPGYGIVADCLANRVPVLYTPRGNFREEEPLVEGLERLGRAILLPRDALERGELGPYLDRLLSLDRPWAEVRLDGAAVAARHLLEMAAF